MIFGVNWKKKSMPDFWTLQNGANMDFSCIFVRFSIFLDFFMFKSRTCFFFASKLQILCTTYTRFCKLQYVLLRHDRHHTVFFCMLFAITSFFWKYFFFEKSLRILADISICPKSRNFGLKNRSFAKSVPKKFGKKNFLEKRSCAIVHTDILIRF